MFKKLYIASFSLFFQLLFPFFCESSLRNELELERDSLKGLAKLTKKGELQSRIDRKNEEIDLLKVGLSGIVKRYGFQTVHDFYKVFSVSKTANAEYRNKVDKWEEQYGEKVQNKEESISKRLRNYQRENADKQNRFQKAETEGQDDMPL